MNIFDLKKTQPVIKLRRNTTKPEKICINSNKNDILDKEKSFISSEDEINSYSSKMFLKKNSKSNDFTNFQKRKIFVKLKETPKLQFNSNAKLTSLTTNSFYTNSSKSSKKTDQGVFQFNSIFNNKFTSNKITTNESDPNINNKKFVLKLNKKFSRPLFRSKNLFKKNYSNNTILKKFGDDFHNVFVGTLDKTKKIFLEEWRKTNKSLYSKGKRSYSILTPNIIVNNSIFQRKINNMTSSYKKLKNNNTTENITQQNRCKTDINNLFRTQYSSQQFKYKNHKRSRSFKEFMNEKNIFDKKWKEKLGLKEISAVTYNNVLLNDLKFQSQIIKDQMSLLLDNVQFFKMSFLNNENLISSFKNKAIIYQTRLNKNLEETCALLHLIPKILLKDYYNYTDKFISLPDPSLDNFCPKIVTNEADCFSENISLLYKMISFVKCCYEVYIQLVEQVEDEMLINKREFETLRAIFEKTRQYITNLTNICKNTLKDYIFDKGLIVKCKKIIEDIKFDIPNDKKEDDYRYFGFESKDSKEQININEKEERETIQAKMSKQIKFRESEIAQKNSRVLKALENNRDFDDIKERRKAADDFKAKQAALAMHGRSGPMALVNSPLMTSMLKYIKHDKRLKIISLRTSERYLNS